MSNIPEGYDENGTRSGHGNWEGTEVIEGEELDIVECMRCKKVIDARSAVKTLDTFLCEVCASEMGLI